MNIEVTDNQLKTLEYLFGYTTPPIQNIGKDVYAVKFEDDLAVSCYLIAPDGSYRIERCEYDGRGWLTLNEDGQELGDEEKHGGF